MNILCIDTEPETVQTIEAEGHVVTQGEFGFRTGRRNMPHPPHEYDLIICDLRQPACFDRTHWGPGKNDNYQCTIEKELKDIHYQTEQGAKPVYEIIHEGQIPRAPVGSFEPIDIFNAVRVAGVPLILFLNKEWIRHIAIKSPNFCNIYWKFKRTTAKKYQGLTLLEEIFINSAYYPELATPLEFAIEKGTAIQSVMGGQFFKTQSLVTNAVSQVFGEVIILERGTIWAIPQLLDNAHFCVELLNNFDTFLAVQSSLCNSTPPLTTATQPHLASSDTSKRDVFISHASEDKEEVVRPLVKALKEKKITVWFDEYELTLGDQLRRSIEEGLKVSRYGVTVFSPNFFQKKWPQEELDALFALESGSKKILPVLHNISQADLLKYSPLIAGRLNISTDSGIAAIADKIERAIRASPSR